MHPFPQNHPLLNWAVFIKWEGCPCDCHAAAKMAVSSLAQKAEGTEPCVNPFKTLDIG